MRVAEASIPAVAFYPDLVKKKAQPTLIRTLAVALSVSADMLLFDKDERGPDDDLRGQFEAASRLDPEEKKVIRCNRVKAAEQRCPTPESGGNSR